MLIVKRSGRVVSLCEIGFSIRLCIVQTAIDQPSLPRRRSVPQFVMTVAHTALKAFFRHRPSPVSLTLFARVVCVTIVFALQLATMALSLKLFLAAQAAILGCGLVLLGYAVFTDRIPPMPKVPDVPVKWFGKGDRADHKEDHSVRPFKIHVEDKVRLNITVKC
jgi:hypothetical protein